MLVRLGNYQLTMPAIILSSGAQFTAAQGDTILDAAAKAGVLLPYSCKTGRCSTCKCKVITGKSSPVQPESGLTEQEQVDGWVLSCVRSAETDLVIEAEGLNGIALPQPKIVPCRIGSLEKLAQDVMRVVMRLPPMTAFNFIPGQYVDVIGPGGMRRSYSIASASLDTNMLELHIRAVKGGKMSDYWFNHAKVNDLLRLNGPLGTFFLRDVADADLIFMATGTGIAPVKALLEAIPSLAQDQRPRSVTVLWGGRVREDLYFDVTALPGKHAYIPVLSRAGQGWNGDIGHVQDALLCRKPDLSKAVIYACGSHAMIRSAQAALSRAGLPSKRFYSDAFVCSATFSSS